MALSYDHVTQITTYLLLGIESKFQYLDILSARAIQSRHPLFIPVVICEIQMMELAKQVHLSTQRAFHQERNIGVNDYAIFRHHEKFATTPAEYEGISRSLNGELSRLANYEKWVSSHVLILDQIFKWPEFQDWRIIGTNDEELKMARIRLEEQCVYLRGWNVDLVAHIQCQQKIVHGQIQTVRFLFYMCKTRCCSTN
jgi:hypothetical protein